MTATNDYDVIVVGGGPSGFIAAIAAGRAGVHTLLIERYGFLGGMPTAASLGPISPFHFGDEQVIAGIPQQFVERLVRSGASTGHLKTTNPHGSGSYLCFYDREGYKWAALSMVREAGVDLLLHTMVAKPIVESNCVTGVTVVNKSGSGKYRARVVVDATGDGDVAARAGAEFVLGRMSDGALQPGTLMFDMANVDTQTVKDYVDHNPAEFEWASECVALRPFSARLEQRHYVAQGLRSLVGGGIAEGSLDLGRDSVLFLTTVHPGVLHFNSTRVKGIDGTDTDSLTHGEIDGRHQVMSLSQFLMERAPGFEHAYLANTGVQIGVRESRHIIGGYVLTADDVVSGRKFDDVVARGYFPVDIHSVSGSEGYVRGGGVWEDLADSYDIPFRCLVPRGIDGLLVAGRAISATHEAHGSFRTQGGVMAIGQAAGTAATLAAQDGVSPREVIVERLQQRLEQDGASLRRDPEEVQRQAKAASQAVAEALAQGRVSRQWLNTGPAIGAHAPRL